MTSGDKRKRIYVVKIGGKWYIAYKARADRYEPRGVSGLRSDDLVWAEDGTTAWLGVVGTEERSEYLEG